LEYEIGDAIAVDIRNCDDAPAAEAAAVKEARSGLQSGSRGEINRRAGAVEVPPINLSGGILEYEIGDAIAVDIRDGDDSPVGEAAAVEEA
jgi:hypothetical protein